MYSTVNFFKTIVISKLILGMMFVMVVSWGIPIEANGTPDSITDSLQSDFQGTFTSTQFDTGVGGVNLSGVNGSGTYTSEVKNAGEVVDWDNVIIQTGNLSAGELPDFGGSNAVISMSDNILLYHFNEPNGAVVWDDTSGNNYDAEIENFGPNMSPNGIFGNAIAFTGRNFEYIVPQDFDLRNQDQFTFVSWINPARVNGNRTIYSEPSAFTLSRDRFTIEINSGVLEVNGRTNESSSAFTYRVISSTPIPANTYTHIGVTIDAVNDQIIIYINGVPEIFSVNVSPFGPNPSILEPVLGIDQDGNGRIYEGLMDEFAVFERILTPVEIAAISSNGDGSIGFQFRSCDDVGCVGESFSGPGGTANPTDAYSITAVSETFLLPDTNYPDSQFFQYRIFFERFPTITSFNPSVLEVTIGFFRADELEISLMIRSSDDQTNTQVCDLGTLSTTTVAECSYRVKVQTNADFGYVLFVRTDGPLRSSTYNILDALDGVAGGSDISASTVGNERYGVTVDPGEATSGNTNVFTLFDAGTNSVLFNYPSEQPLIQSDGPNQPLAVDTDHTVLVTHSINISGDTPAGSYNQRVIYSVVPQF